MSRFADIKLKAQAGPLRKALAAFVGLVLLAALGGGLVWNNYTSVKRYNDQLRSTIIRESLVALNDAYRLKDAVVGARLSGEFTPEALTEIGRATDFLVVRASSISRELSPSDAATYQTAIYQNVVALSELGDSILSGDRQDPNEALRDLASYVSELRLQSFRFLNRNSQRQQQALRQSENSLERLSQFISCLLVLLTGIGCWSLFLLRREVLVRSAREAAEKRVQHLAFYDQVTELANRTRFYQVLDEYLSAGQPVSLFFMDLDTFKRINDTYGHAGGDAVLRATAKRVATHVASAGGLASRLGGDEFAAIIPIENDKMLEIVAKKILASMEQPVSFRGSSIQARISIGIALAGCNGIEGADRIDMLVSAADFALYEAKSAGRDVYRFFDCRSAQRMQERRELIQGIPMGLAAGEFLPYYQPKADLNTGEIIGFEALIRWHRGDRVIEPAGFIALAEESRVVMELDVAMLRQATRDFSRWNQRLERPLGVSVNLSTLHFSSVNIVNEVRDALATSGLQPGCLTLEITESVLIEDWDQVGGVLDQLRLLGVRLSLDDFGTGYSSLAYLRKIQADELKIDRSFVEDIEVSDETRFMMDAIVDMARSLEMSVVVEGIENGKQIEILRLFGCDMGQGYFWSQPMSAQAVEATYVGGSARSGAEAR